MEMKLQFSHNQIQWVWLSSFGMSFASSSFMQNRQNNKVDVIEGEIV
jgi:transposase